MSGSTPRWDQPPDPRESTVDLPRVADFSPPAPPSRPERADRASADPGESATAGSPATFPAGVPLTGPYLTAAELRARYPNGLRLAPDRQLADVPAEGPLPAGPPAANSAATFMTEAGGGPGLGQPAAGITRPDEDGYLSSRDDPQPAGQSTGDWHIGLGPDRPPADRHDNGHARNGSWRPGGLQEPGRDGPAPLQVEVEVEVEDRAEDDRPDGRPLSQGSSPGPEENRAGRPDYSPAPQPDPPGDRDYAPGSQQDPPGDRYSPGPWDDRPAPQDYRGVRQDRPAPGSLGDLRRRLELLPAGHPSSPYEDDGSLQQGPPRLRHLELPLSDEERDADAHSWRTAAAATVAAARNPAAGGALLPATDWLASSAGLASSDAASVNGSPPVLATAADDPAPDGVNGQASPGPADPEQAAPAYAAADSEPALSRRPLPGIDVPSGDAAPAEDLTAAYRHATGAPADGTPGEADPGDAEPIGSRQPAAGAIHTPDGRLTTEQERLAEHALTRFRTAEGRTVFGSYGASGITPAIQRVAAQLPTGGLAPGSDQNSLKEPGRFRKKLAILIARNPGLPAGQLVTSVYDAVRYAFIFEPADYTDGTWLVHRRLKAQGFELEVRRNRWDSPEYKGIRTQWRDPAHDLPFEVQFHTPASWDVLQRTHESCLVITDPATPPAERARLRAGQVAASTVAPAPPRCAEIADFRMAPR